MISTDRRAAAVMNDGRGVTQSCGGASQDRADRAACVRLWKLERAELVSEKERFLF